jgi:hypothetical protein
MMRGSHGFPSSFLWQFADTALFIRERMMAFAFLAHDNYDSSGQLKITQVIDIFIDKERGSEFFDTNPPGLLC